MNGKNLTGTGQRIGALLQGVILGGLLFAALVELANVSGAAQLFRYQGF